MTERTQIRSLRPGQPIVPGLPPMSEYVWNLPERLFQSGQKSAECRVTWWNDPQTRERVIRLDKADPHITITDELLADLTEHGWAGEGLFMIEGFNATVRYRLVEHDESLRFWTASRIGPDPLSTDESNRYEATADV